jgi:Na+-transporting methylmalonyl-CoA/oxaloacetate decarboxylase gamma subunit
VKKIVILMVLIFLAFSLSGLSQERSSKKPQPVKTEEVKKVSTKSGSRPKKPAKKRIHRRGTMRHGHEVKL